MTKISSVHNLELETLSLHFSVWRERQLEALSQEIQEKIHSLQSPPKTECHNVRKIRCSTSVDGFGSQIHQILTCLLSGYFTGSLVIIDHFLDNYLRNSSLKWDHYISAISELCQPFSNYSYPHNVLDIDIKFNGISKKKKKNLIMNFSI
jgi:hypothetical protein